MKALCFILCFVICINTTFYIEASEDHGDYIVVVKDSSGTVLDDELFQGQITAYTNVNSEYYNGDMNSVTLVIAYYYNNLLIDIGYDVSEALSIETQELSAKVEVDTIGEGYYIKMLILDNLAAMRPLRDVSIIRSSRVITEQEMTIYKERFIESLLSSTNNVTSIIRDINEDGSWADINYTGVSGSIAYVHCQRFANIAKAVANPESNIYNNEEVIGKLASSIEYWIDRDIKFSNWFQNEIRIPEAFGDTLLVAGTMLPASTEERAREYLEYKVITLLDPGENDVGSNAVQIQLNRIRYALYVNDVVRLKSAFDRIGEEVTIVNKLGEDNEWRDRLWTNYVRVQNLPDTREGIQVDYSNLFHGPLIYSGGYGLTFISEIADMMVATRDTNLFPKAGLEDLVNHILEHYRYIVRGTTIDYSTLGRQIATDGNFVSSKNATTLYSTVQKLSQIIDIPRQDELIALYESSLDTIFTPSITGHKYYWKADYTAHPKDNFLLTVRTSSNRTLASEAVNTVNLKGDFLADGSTYIYRTGKEYEDIFAAWDWCKIPGTTTQVRDFTPIMIQHNALAGSNSDFAGGVTDNKNGATAMELVRDGISAKKSWFMFDNELVALGADIQNTTTNNCITTVNQALLNGNVTVGTANDESNILNKGSNLDQTVNWVHHDNIGYVFNKSTKVSIENKEFIGDRIDINYGGLLVRPDKNDFVKKDIFSLWFDHTKDNTDRYEYIVIPEITTSSLEAYAEDNPINIISNDSRLQAVENTDLNVMQAVFWTPGMVRLIDGTQITVDGQVIIQTTRENEKFVFSIASLNAKDDIVNVQITGDLKGNGATLSDGITTFNIKLPSGDYAGKSIILEFDINNI